MLFLEYIRNHTLKKEVWEMDKNHLVTQSNLLIEARHIKPLSLNEQRIVLAMVSMIQPNDEDFQEYKISISEFQQLCGLKNKNIYSEISKVVDTLMEKVITIPHEDKAGWLKTHWITASEYFAGEGMIHLSFDPRLKPYLLQLKTAFTSYRLSNILSLKSAYALRLYELMKKWQQIGRWTVDIEELRLKLGVPKDKLQQYNHFKTRALKAGVDEINAKTDLKITFKEIKKGRKVDKIQFTISRRSEKEIEIPLTKIKKETTKSQQSPEETLRNKMNKHAKEFSFDQVSFHDMYTKANDMWNTETEKNMLNLLLHVRAASKINNRVGYFRSIINKGHTRFLNGEAFNVDDFSISKNEGIPKWFKQPDGPVQEDLDDNFEIEKQRLENELVQRTTKKATE
jgi:plasmid replication initiation protein